MTLTKEDYMKLPKERLAELLVERDAPKPTIYNPFSQIVRPCLDCPLRCDYKVTCTSANTDEIKD